jgi:hypothetical protein
VSDVVRVKERWAVARVAKYGLSRVLGVLEQTWRYWRPSSVFAILQGWQTRIRFPVPDGTPVELVPELESTLVEVAASFDGGMIGDSGTGKIAIVCGMAKAIGARRILEVGTCGGFMTRHLAVNCGAESHVWTIDLPDGAAPTVYSLGEADQEVVGQMARAGRVPGWYTVGAPEGDRITRVLCDSAAYDYRDVSTPLDFAFIDGSHSYEYVLTDSWNAISRLRAGGIIVWDDYLNFFPGVLRAVGEIGDVVPVRAFRGSGLAAAVMPSPWPSADAEMRLRRLVEGLRAPL